MCGTEVAITAPLTKKTAPTAQRARVSIDRLETRESTAILLDARTGEPCPPTAQHAIREVKCKTDQSFSIRRE
jgi:hypothetical protein